jgi:hypothetical protein
MLNQFSRTISILMDDVRELQHNLKHHKNNVHKVNHHGHIKQLSQSIMSTPVNIQWNVVNGVLLSAFRKGQYGQVLNLWERMKLKDQFTVSDCDFDLLNKKQTDAVLESYASFMSVGQVEASTGVTVNQEMSDASFQGALDLMNHPSTKDSFAKDAELFTKLIVKCTEGDAYRIAQAVQRLNQGETVNFDTMTKGDKDMLLGLIVHSLVENTEHHDTLALFLQKHKAYITGKEDFWNDEQLTAQIQSICNAFEQRK